MSPTKRRVTGVQGRADLHIHTMASDGTAGVAQVLARAEEARLDVIAITDHDRIDAAKAADDQSSDDFRRSLTMRTSR